MTPPRSPSSASRRISGLFQRARLQAGETVFVNGGTGGVGSMVVQMAKAVGAKAITTVGSDEKAELCRSWGADCVLNYKTDDIPARIKDFTNGQGVNVWYETQREPDFIKTVDLMARRGRMIVMAGRQAQPTFPVGPFYVKDLSLYGFAMFNATPDEQRICADDINRWLAEKKLQVADRQDIQARRGRGGASLPGGEHAAKGRHADRQGRAASLTFPENLDKRSLIRSISSIISCPKIGPVWYNCFRRLPLLIQGKWTSDRLMDEPSALC